MRYLLLILLIASLSVVLAISLFSIYNLLQKPASVIVTLRNISIRWKMTEIYKLPDRGASQSKVFSRSCSSYILSEAATLLLLISQGLIELIQPDTSLIAT
ncbi:MAG: hypothetical protein AB4080_04895 [Trichodesmium sp.]